MLASIILGHLIKDLAQSETCFCSSLETLIDLRQFPSAFTLSTRSENLCRLTINDGVRNVWLGPSGLDCIVHSLFKKVANLWGYPLSCFVKAIALVGKVLCLNV